MNTTTIICALLIGAASAPALATVHALAPGQIYMGQEAVNERLTGNNCFITVQRVEPFAEKGLHCNSIDFLFASERPDVPKDTLRVDSRVTNYHRAEYPKVRTCAVNVDGTTSGDEIYGQDTTALYNQIFGGAMTTGGVSYDYFLTLSPRTKEVARARVHIRDSSTEKDVDCVRLEKM